jgi:hypothetical protein
LNHLFNKIFPMQKYLLIVRPAITIYEYILGIKLPIYGDNTVY